MNQNIKNKKKYLGILINFHHLDNIFITWSIILKQLDKNFEKIYFINSQNLEIFRKKKKFKLNKKILSKLKLKNFYFEDIKNTKHFENFVRDKELILINSYPKNLNLIKIYFLLKKYKIKQFQITNIGNEQYSNTIPNKFFARKMLFFFRKKVNPLIVSFLSLIGVVDRVEVRFTSTKTWIDNINKNFIKKYLYKNGLFYAKKLILVNSIAYDTDFFSKHKIFEKYIIHIDTAPNYYHKTDIRGALDKKSYDNHYKYLSLFLRDISKFFNKKLIVCIHPSYNLNEHQKMLRPFKVVKYNTRELIKKAYLVTFFDSTVILDAVVQEKRLIGIISEFMSYNDILRQKAWSKNIGCANQIINNKYKFNKNKYLTLKRAKKNKYYNYSKKYLKREKEPGITKIIKYLKRNYIN